MKLQRNIFLFILIFIFFSNSSIFAQNKQGLQKKWNLVSIKLSLARDFQATFNDPLTADLLNKSDINLRRARRQIRAGHPLVANRLINSAEIAINQALKELLREPVQQRRKKLEKKIQEAEDIVRENTTHEATDLLDKGIQNKRLAEQLFKENKFQESLKHFRQAEYQVQKSIDLVKNRDRSIKDLANEEAIRFEQLFNRADKVISNSANSTVEKNYRSVMKLSQKAERAKAEGNFRLSIDIYYEATRLLLRTLDIAEGKTDRSVSRAYEEVTALDELIDNIQQKVKPFEDDERVLFFMTRIIQLQEDAHQALEDKNYQLVLLNTQYARDLIERIHKRLRGGQGEMYEIIIQELKKLEVDLDDINDQVLAHGKNEEAEVLLTYATAAKIKAGELLKNNNYQLARESILVANRFAFTADRLIRNRDSEKASSEIVLQKIVRIEKKISNLQSRQKNFSRIDIQIYFDHAQKMLNLARNNFDKGYFNVANECIESSNSAFEKLRTLLR